MADRKSTDFSKARDLASRSGGMLAIDRLAGSEVACRVHIPTARNEAFPGSRQETSRILLQLPPRYPFEKPQVSFQTPIWNPNVFASGRLCYGDWKVMEFLDLFLIRLMRIVALDPLIINLNSPANAGAAAWYRSTLRAQPELFPTRQVESLIRREVSPEIQWRNIR